MKPTNVGLANTSLYECLASMNIFPITNTYERYVVARNEVDIWFAVRGQAVVALALRRYPGETYKFDHCWRFARFFEFHIFELRYKSNTPEPVSYLKLLLTFYISFHF